jgi:ABC-2 type transport system ATP-binding protein
VEALVGIDLSVSRGECFGLLGPNGAGKTTTIEILEGLLEATSGEVEILGMSWAASPSAIKNRIGISLQETKLAEKLSVRETLTLFRSFYTKGMSADEAIALVSLEEKAESWVGKLSGGQKQRLAVATALVGDPDLLFLDEPTTGLDPQSRRQLWDIIRQLRQRGRTVLLTTHYMDEAERLCDRIAVVDHGKIIALGSPRELIAGLGGEHVIEFSLDGESPDATFAALPGVRSVAHEGPTIRLTVSETHVTLKALLSELSKADIELTSLTTRHASLEDVFVSLTGRHLRDDSGDDADAP